MSKYIHIIDNGPTNIVLYLNEIIGTVIVSQSGEIAINTPPRYGDTILRDYGDELHVLRLEVFDSYCVDIDNPPIDNVYSEREVFIHKSSYGGDGAKLIVRSGVNA